MPNADPRLSASGKFPIPMKCSRKAHIRRLQEKSQFPIKACKGYTVLGLKNRRLKSFFQIPRELQRTPGKGDGELGNRPFWVCVGICKPHQAPSRPANFHHAREREPCCCFCSVNLNKSGTSSNGHSVCPGPSSASWETQTLLFFSP